MPTTEKALQIAAPRADREPMKTNAFFFVQSANAELSPLFPYMGPGDIVPCIAFMRGDDGNYGHFVHYNDVDEIALCLGANGSRVRPGIVFVGPNMHDVAGPDGSNPNEYMMMVITQRQKPEGVQKEAIRFLCHKCSNELMVFEFDGSCAEDAKVPGLPTIIGTEAAAAKFNSSDARKCGKCGHENPDFPKNIWGWKTYEKHTELARWSREGLEGAVQH